MTDGQRELGFRRSHAIGKCRVAVHPDGLLLTIAPKSRACRQTRGAQVKLMLKTIATRTRSILAAQVTANSPDQMNPLALPKPSQVRR